MISFGIVGGLSCTSTMGVCTRKYRAESSKRSVTYRYPFQTAMGETEEPGGKRGGGREWLRMLRFGEVGIAARSNQAIVAVGTCVASVC